LCRSRSSTTYLVQDPEVVQEAIAAVGDEKQEVEKADIPDDLFAHVVGHDEVKHWVSKSLASPRPVHILLAGPPATAKSMFLQALGSLPGSQ